LRRDKRKGRERRGNLHAHPKIEEKKRLRYITQGRTACDCAGISVERTSAEATLPEER